MPVAQVESLPGRPTFDLREGLPDTDGERPRVLDGGCYGASGLVLGFHRWVHNPIHFGILQVVYWMVQSIYWPEMAGSTASMAAIDGQNWPRTGALQGGLAHHGR